ncbi:MAG: hypothetical protein FJZ87_00175 [Chloroflexi bacterium]|nr:hypothetical protein [Chloroflexota bacterium]
MDADSLTQTLLTAFLSSAVLSTVVGLIFRGWAARLEMRVKSQHSWKEQSVTELLAPLNMQFARTEKAFRRWNSKNLYLEMKVVKAGNETIRDLLLAKGHLIPPELREDAGKLIEHYDVWLEKFEKQRLSENPDLNAPFVFVGPDGYPFPTGAERNFRETFKRYWIELYGDSGK